MNKQSGGMGEADYNGPSAAYQTTHLTILCNCISKFGDEHDDGLPVTYPFYTSPLVVTRLYDLAITQ